MLQSHCPGTFLVRDSESDPTPGSYVLSLKWVPSFISLFIINNEVLINIFCKFYVTIE